MFLKCYLSSTLQRNPVWTNCLSHSMPKRIINNIQTANVFWPIAENLYLRKCWMFIDEMLYQSFIIHTAKKPLKGHIGRCLPKLIFFLTSVLYYESLWMEYLTHLVGPKGPPRLPRSGTPVLSANLRIYGTYCDWQSSVVCPQLSYLYLLPKN